jgi:hypothetical protein
VTQRRPHFHSHHFELFPTPENMILVVEVLRRHAGADLSVSAGAVLDWPNLLVGEMLDRLHIVCARIQTPLRLMYESLQAAAVRPPGWKTKEEKEEDQRN